MRFCSRKMIAALLIATPVAGFAASCTTQAELAPQDRSTLASIGEQLSEAVIRQDTSALQAVLLPVSRYAVRSRADVWARTKSVNP